MKISSEQLSASINKINPGKPDHKPKAEVALSPAPESSANTAQQRMLSLFARVGIHPNMAMNDNKLRQDALDRRKRMLETQKVSNLRSILDIAMSVQVSDGSTDAVDPDWFHAFSALAENIHSPAMQELWGKIFAVEVNHPGSFSLRSLETLRALTQRDAKLFSRAASIACRRSSDTVPRLLVGYHQRKGLLSMFSPSQPPHLNLSTYGLSYPDILALIDMKLLFASEIESGEFPPGVAYPWRCANESFTLSARRQGTALVYYKFTSVGAELYKLVGRHDHKQYLAALKSMLSQAFVVT